MKVVISASTSWYPFNFRLNTLKALLELGHVVYVVAPKDEYSSRYEALGVKYVDIQLERGGVNPLEDLKTLYLYYKIYSVIKPDIIFNFTPKCNIYSSLAGRMFTKDIVNNMSGLGAGLSKKNFVYYCSVILYYFSQKCAKKIFFQNRSDLELLTNKGIVQKCKCDLVPGSGIDLTRFSFSPKPQGEVISFIFSGRFLYSKGVGLFSEAAIFLKRKYGEKVHFQILGFLDEKAVNSVSQMTLDSWVDQGILENLGSTDDVVPFVRKASCIVLPSYYAEGVPKSLLEAGALGLPIITTNSVGCRETVEEHKNGFLCEPQSLESLIDCMVQFVELPEEDRIQMGVNSRKKMETDFDETIVIEKYMDMVRRVK